MKTTKKITAALLFALALFNFNETKAQETTNYDQGFRLGFGLNAGYANEDPYKLALGADARLQYDLTKRYSITLTTGFNNIFVSENDGDDLGFIPVKAGLKAFVWNDQFYLTGEAGAAFAVTNNYNDTSLLLSPGIGYANKYIDISARYEHYSDFPTINNDGTPGKGFGQFALRLAYGFKL
ncbi:hypothetical protein GCM10008015_21750 [Flavobacterium palustre]|uniref:Outer membrane protein beta-barrel domain-containing protein n=1 Tax=Flavobacterium palustre TaxID=1476463 RepID=A0ABQ1HJU3_9FLAO|nr:hypothetical protein [Flavobacterium palustre]GGA80669.1 hypothetical protein GCM10008015_21750 [Flavobacterium palustre]